MFYHVDLARLQVGDSQFVLLRMKPNCWGLTMAPRAVSLEVQSGHRRASLPSDGGWMQLKVVPKARAALLYSSSRVWFKSSFP